MNDCRAPIDTGSNPSDGPSGAATTFGQGGGERNAEMVKGTHRRYCFPERAAHHPEAAEARFRKAVATRWRTPRQPGRLGKTGQMPA